MARKHGHSNIFKGEKSETKKPRHLKPQQRDDIAQRATSGEKKSDLAKEYGVSRAAVTKICQRESELLNINEAGEPGSSSNHFVQESSYPMIPVEEAIATVLSHTIPLVAERVLLHQAYNCILSEDVICKNPVPDFRASKMDGYAIRSIDGPGEFPVVDAVMAGDVPSTEWLDGSVTYITTGAPVPEAADAVVKVEDTHIVNHGGNAGDGRIVKIMTTAQPGQNIRNVGDDITKGSTVLLAGTQLTPAAIGILATIGATDVSVVSKPVVGILSTGSELLRNANTGLIRGQIYDSNRPMLLAATEGAGVVVKDLGVCGDIDATLEMAIRTALEEVDVLVTTGGVSMGQHDFVKPILERIGQVHFGRLLMKPGKPTTFATLKSAENKTKLVFALPGNPVSALVTFNLLVCPALRKLQGVNDDACVQPRVMATLQHSIRLDPYRPEFHRAVVSWDNDLNQFIATSTGRQESSRLLSCIDSNALLCLPMSQNHAEAGFQCPALLTGPLQASVQENKNTLSADSGRNSLDTLNITVCLLTISDSVSQGLAQDRSGPAMEKALVKWNKHVIIVERATVPDDLSQIQTKVQQWCEEINPHIILTSGGTGFGPRDVTPEAIRPLLERETPGLLFQIFQKGLQITPMAALSRAVIGIRAETLIVTLPGSTKSVTENIQAIQSVLEHGIHLIRDLPHGHHKSKTSHTRDVQL